MENISKKLQDSIPAFENEKKFSFKLLSARYDSKLNRLIVPTNRKVVAEDVIFDPYSKKNVEIRCIERRVPVGQGVNGSDIVLKQINFDRKENGKKVLDGKSKRDLNLFEYLYLSNFNRANKYKPWHITPKNGYIYEFQLPEKTAEEKLQEKKDKIRAQQIVMDFSDDEVMIVAEALSKSTGVKGFIYNSSMETNQLRDRLTDFAEKNSSVMLNFDKTFNMEARKLVKAAIDGGLIMIDDNKKVVNWADTGR
jgi:hypothetical protein